MKDTDTQITKHNNDVIMKAMAETFSDKSLSFFGLNVPKILDVAHTVLPVLEVRENRTDFIFLLEDDSYLHLEFQTTFKLQDLKRFALYDARIINKYDRDINTAVIYSGKIEVVPNSFKKGSLSYEVKNIYMKDFDGDEEYRKLNDKIYTNVQLADEDVLKLIFLPLMKSRFSEEEMALNAAELAKEIPGEAKTFILAAIIAVSDKFLSDTYRNKLLEVLKMTQIEQMIREEAKKEGKNESQIEFAQKALSAGIDEETVLQITGLTKETLKKLKNT